MKFTVLFQYIYDNERKLAGDSFLDFLYFLGFDIKDISKRNISYYKEQLVRYGQNFG